MPLLPPQRIVPSQSAGSPLPHVDAPNWQDIITSVVYNLMNRADIVVTITGGDGNHLIGTAQVPMTEYVDGMNIWFTPLFTNTLPPDIDIDGVGAIQMRSAEGAVLGPDDLTPGYLYSGHIKGGYLIVNGPGIGFNPPSGVSALLADYQSDVDISVSSSQPYYEEPLESFQFTTTEPNQVVEFNMRAPVIIYSAGSFVAGAKNGAVRVYVDGTDWNYNLLTAPGDVGHPQYARQWNAGQSGDIVGPGAGFLLGNTGQWCYSINTPNDIVLAITSIRKTIPLPGVHVVRIHGAGTTTDTVVSLHARRNYQVSNIKALKGDTGTTGPSGVSNFTSVHAASGVNINLASGLVAGSAIGGTTVVAGLRYLLFGQTDPSKNGIYLGVASGAATRVSDFDTYDEHVGRVFFVQEGLYALKLFRSTALSGGTLDTTALTFTAFVEGTDLLRRELLSANRTYYVRADGNDSNTGLVNSAGGAFLTIQKAIDAASALDLGIYSGTIEVGAGTFTGVNTLKRYIGVGPITINGVGSTTIISVTGNSCFVGIGTPRYVLKNFKPQTTTSGNGFIMTAGAVLEYDGIDFGACAGIHIFAASNAVVTATGNYSISGGAANHLWADSGARINAATRTVTLSGTPAFSGKFAEATMGGSISAVLMTFPGTGATGVRYNAANGGIINAGAVVFPGSTAGTGTNFGTSPYGLVV